MAFIIFYGYILLALHQNVKKDQHIIILKGNTDGKQLYRVQQDEGLQAELLKGRILGSRILDNF
jgi:hypothetical protein